MQYTPTVLEDDHFRLNLAVSAATATASEPELSGVKEDTADAIDRLTQSVLTDRWGKVRADGDEDVPEDAQSITTRTDDDPVREAFEQALDAPEDDDDEEQIVWQLGSVPLSTRPSDADRGVVLVVRFPLTRIP